MIQRLSLGVGQRKTNEIRWQMLVGRVGFEQEPVRRNVFEGLALAKFALVQKIAGKAEIRAKPSQGGDHFHRPAEAVQHHAPRRTRMVAQQFMEAAPGLQTMDAHWQVALGGQPQLREKNLLLIRVPDPKSGGEGKKVE